MYKLRKYHGDRVQSLTYEKEGKSASVGILEVGEYEFGAIGVEHYTVTSGKIYVWNDNSNDWVGYKTGESFEISDRTNFKLKVDEISTYICFYE